MSDTTPASAETGVRPFRIEVPEREIEELRRRIDATRWPTKELVADRSQGVQLAATQEMHVLVCVNPGNHALGLVVVIGHHGCAACSVEGGGGKQWPGGWTRQGVGLIAQAPLRSHVRPTGRLPITALRSSGRQVSSWTRSRAVLRVRPDEHNTATNH
jgi:Epoxide hydrolase N terminus